MKTIMPLIFTFLSATSFATELNTEKLETTEKWFVLKSGTECTPSTTSKIKGNMARDKHLLDCTSQKCVEAKGDLSPEAVLKSSATCSMPMKENEIGMLAIHCPKLGMIFSYARTLEKCEAFRDFFKKGYVKDVLDLTTGKGPAWIMNAATKKCLKAADVLPNDEATFNSVLSSYSGCIIYKSKDLSRKVHVLDCRSSELSTMLVYFDTLKDCEKGANILRKFGL